MKCTNCGANNDSSAKFCRYCGNLLKMQSILELYPEFHFQPTTTFLLKGNKSWWFAIIPLSVLFLIGLYVAGGSIFYEGLVHGDTAFAFLGGGTGILVAIVSFIFLKKCYKKTKPIEITDIADYVEGIAQNRRYSIIVKNGLWGLYNISQHKIQIACQYDFLKWDSDNSILRATKNNENVLIDIYNNTLK